MTWVMAPGAAVADARAMSAALQRPRRLRIDPRRCRHAGLCRALAAEIDDPDDISVTAATLDAMANCPSGALGWREEAEEPRSRE